MPPATDLDCVTGAFSYTGKYVTRRLLARGRRVRTLTGHPDRPDPFDGRVPAFPYSFDAPGKLRETLAGVDTLYNTYWVRFDYGDATYDRAVTNSLALFRAAEEAGVRRIVHVSIANPAEDSPFAYYRGKAKLEKALAATRVSHAIVRPTVIYGAEDILINNIAWCLNSFPVFAVPGDGQYRMQPIFVEEMADLMVETGQRSANETFDAAGPEVFTFDGWLDAIGGAIGAKVWHFHAPPWLAYHLSRIVGWCVGDVILTREEVGGLMADLLASKEPPRGKTRLSDWLATNAGSVGSAYASELKRHYRR